jgi:hypothetical protein
MPVKWGNRAAYYTEDHETAAQNGVLLFFAGAAVGVPSQQYRRLNIRPFVKWAIGSRFSGEAQS